jgi:lipopolysaccharide biosynthesis glycosyltransferase
LFADVKPDQFTDGAPSPFNSFATLENPHPRSKVDCIFRSPFDETLYLDSDTRVVTDIRELFILLGQYDMALAHEAVRNTPKCSWKREIPPSFPEFNSGVILYKNNPAVIGLLKAWQQAYHEAGFFQDQVTLRELLWETKLRVAVLPPEYNVIMLKYPFVWRKGEAVPKILHLRKYLEGRSWMLRGVERAFCRLQERLKGNSKFIVDG